MFPLVQSGCSVNRDLTVGSVVTADAAELGPMTVVPSGNLIRYTVPVWFPAGAMYRPAKFWEGLWLFFSSRRRHTICSRDWSSDVCSSDLQRRGPDRPAQAACLGPGTVV